MGALLAGASAGAIAADEKDKPNAGNAPSRAPFEPGKVWNVQLAFDAKEYAAMQPRGGGGFPGFGFAPKPKPAEDANKPAREVHRNKFGMDLPWATGTLTIGDETFKDVGIRYLGNGTIADASGTIKKSFKIDLDHFADEGRWLGVKKINLHCGVADPSKCRETLGYAAYRAAGVPAPRTSLAEVRLTVPGKYDQELLGVYTIVEHIDKPFLRAFYGTDKGLLMKPEGLRDLDYRGEDWERYKKNFVPKREATGDESKRIMAFVRLIHKAGDETFRKEIGSYLDVDAYLRFLAATAYVANSDSFFVLGHNFYIYMHPTGKFHFIPWDLDRSFANFPILGSNDQQMNMSFTHPYSGSHRLTERVLASPGVTEKYRKLLKELADTSYEKERMLKEVASVEATVKDLVDRGAKAAEARKERGGPGMFGKPPILTTFVEKRTESLAAQIAGTSKGYVPTGGFGQRAFKAGEMMAGPFLGVFDTDKDGKLSRDEWLTAAKKVFDACEKDSEKRVTEASMGDAINGMLPKPPGPPGGQPPKFGPGNFMAGGIFQRVGADKDGKITLEKLVAEAGKLFDQFDKGKTGKLDESAFSDMLTALFPAPNFGPPGGPPGGGPRGGPPGFRPGGPPNGPPGGFPGGPPAGPSGAPRVTPPGSNPGMP